ncbi:TetR/AcrR family transcriptional regulator [Pleomorphomonas oryzae]|uniref:TetR/AcrR family transcriptional regulator n=1 Tax=Pleomorphomonas oryzae TaxID=261934 RepID=UPI000422C7A2|nr:TetR/AcrR family transcriptional regulator [Pleomorphomonas oryzae]
MTSDDERRTAILEAAAHVFATKGFSGATTAEIAKLARVSKRDLYDHFESKEGLLAAMVRAYSTTLPFADDLGSPDTLDAFLDLLGKFGRRFAADLYQPHRTALFRLAASEAGRVNELGKAIHEAGAGPVAASVRVFVGKAIAAGVLTPQNADLAMRTFFGILLGDRHVWQIVGAADTPTPEEIAASADMAVKAVRRIIAS